ncbi:MAG TPA: hypothetical protein VM533_21640 [Fimbriiglobus sp.]|jgi:hypothetical protein|nr:hypothetical protein [Fimbriiglobus sp.]
MNTPLPPDGRLEVRDATGQLVGYFVPAAELDQLRAERDSLKKVVDALRPLPPMTDDELRQLMEGPHYLLSDIIAELDKEGEQDGNG